MIDLFNVSCGTKLYLFNNSCLFVWEINYFLENKSQWECYTCSILMTQTQPSFIFRSLYIFLIENLKLSKYVANWILPYDYIDVVWKFIFIGSLRKNFFENFSVTHNYPATRSFLINERMND